MINYMKTIKILLSLMLITLLSSCSQDTKCKQENSRIKLVDQKVINHTTVMIINVDGTEYLCNYHGGFIKLE